MAVTPIQWGLTWREFLEQLASDPKRRRSLTEAIAGADYEALFWEAPPVSPATLDSAFEFVLVDAPQLARVNTDAGAFREHFERPDGDPWVQSFHNLGRDAVLVLK